MSVAEAVDVKTGPQPANILALQRRAFLRAGPPDLAQRKEDIKKLRDAIKQEAGQIASVISEDFGNRSRHETLLADVWPVLSSARETLKHLAGWMKPKRVGVGLELMPGRARILYQPVGVVGIISPWNYPFQLALMPLIAALAAGNRVMLKPSELTPRTSDFLLISWEGCFLKRRSPRFSAGLRSALPSPRCPSTICSTPARRKWAAVSCAPPPKT